jgi:DNA repair exonuclease SbcCD ATPase subunit
LELEPLEEQEDLDSYLRETVEKGQSVKSAELSGSLTDLDLLDEEINNLFGSLIVASGDLSQVQGTEGIDHALAEIDAVDIKEKSQELLPELVRAKEQLSTAIAELRQVSTFNEEKANQVEYNFQQVSKLKLRTEQLAKYSKIQLKKIEDIIGGFETIRNDILRGIEQFGGYDNLKPILKEIGEANNSLVLAQQTLEKNQGTFYTSLKEIENNVIHHNQETENKLLKTYQDISGALVQLEANKQKINQLTGDITNHLNAVQKMRDDIIQLHGGIENKTVDLQQKIISITSGFNELSQTVKHEKQQFYQLTSETINKADAMRSQFAEIARQINQDRNIVQDMKKEIHDLRIAFDQEAIKQYERLNKSYEEIVESWGDVKLKQKTIESNQRAMQKWLKMITIIGAVAIVILFAIVITKPF